MVLLAFYYVLAAAAAALGLSWIATLYFRLLPLTVLWYVYGVSLSCFPMLPTCLLSDLGATANQIVPASISLPPELIVRAANSTTLRPCAELNFTSWADPLAFALCDMDEGLCESVADAPSGGIAAVQQLQAAINQKLAVLRNATSTAVYAQRICAWTTWVLTLPVALALLALAVAGQYIVCAILELGPPFMGLFSAVVAFGRTPDA